jgi:hypothetical protein
MPKIVVYVRAEDARTIAAMEKKSIEEWTRQTLARAIEDWKRSAREDDA